MTHGNSWERGSQWEKSTDIAEFWQHTGKRWEIAEADVATKPRGYSVTPSAEYIGASSPGRDANADPGWFGTMTAMRKRAAVEATDMKLPTSGSRAVSPDPTSSPLPHVQRVWKQTAAVLALRDDDPDSGTDSEPEDSPARRRRVLQVKQEETADE